MQNSLFQNKYVRGLVVLVLVGAVGALASYTFLTLKQAKGTYTAETTISVNGTGEVFAKPDIGTFTFSVQSSGADAAIAQGEGAKVMDAVVAYLKESGVEEKDIKTEYYNLNPKYRYEEKMCAFGGYCPPSEPIQDGFEVYQGVTVKVRNLETSGQLISGAGERGATNISSLSFTIDDASTLKNDARTAAITDAKAKAQTLADSLGMELGDLVGFNEDGYNPMYYGKGGMMEADAVAAPMMNAVVPTGENMISSNVTLMYELK